MQQTDPDASPRPTSRVARFGTVLLWTLAVPVMLGLSALLTQFGSWGLWAGTIAALVSIVVIAIVVGGAWGRGWAATVGCIAGFVGVLFVGPTLYELYMQAFAEPTEAAVARVYEDDDVRHCVVVEVDRTVHDLDQRQNCFDHIDELESVTLEKDTLGLLPPRLEDAPDRGTGAASPTGIAVGAGLLGLAGGSVLYGGLRRRNPALATNSRPQTSKGQKTPTDPPLPRGLVWLEVPRRLRRNGSSKREDPKDGMAAIQTTSDGSGTNGGNEPDGGNGTSESEPATIGYVERSMPPVDTDADYRKARKRGIRYFVIWADPERKGMLARVVTTADATPRTPQYDVQDESGRSLAGITRRRAGLFPPRRARWIVRQDGKPPANGRKGRLVWWAVWWLTLPLQVVLVILSVFGGDGVVIRMPLRTKWRAERRVVLDYRRKRLMWNRLRNDHLYVRADWWDPRVTAALTALVRSYDSVLGDRWDLRP